MPPLPSVGFQKIDGGTGVVRPSDVGVLAIIAPSEKGTVNQAEMFLRTDVALGVYGGGALVECAAYVMPECAHPAILVKATGTTPAAYGSLTLANQGGGTSVPTADADDPILPLDDYDVFIKFIAGGTIGITGITYTYSLDGGVTTSAVQGLGTANTIVIPNSGVTIDLAAGTIIAGFTVAFHATGPIATNADLVNALEALRVTRSPFEAVLFHGAADATTVGDFDTWIKAQQLTGRFKLGICTARARKTDGTETEAQYKTFLQGIFGATSSLDVIVCADVGDVSSPIPGRATTAIVQARPSGWAVAARLMKIPMGRDAAFVDDGPVGQFAISDARGGPNHHDEYMNPGLDDLRITTLRSWDGREGTYITNANVLSPSGSDYVYAQHARCINRACEIGFQFLSGQLSRGVKKNPKAGPNGERYIAEGAALRIESGANDAIRAELAGQVDDLQFKVSRTDDISPNSGADVHGAVESVSLGYIKKFSITAGYVKSISKS